MKSIIISSLPCNYGDNDFNFNNLRAKDFMVFQTNINNTGLEDSITKFNLLHDCYLSHLETITIIGRYKREIYFQYEREEKYGSDLRENDLRKIAKSIIQNVQKIAGDGNYD